MVGLPAPISYPETLESLDLMFKTHAWMLSWTLPGLRRPRFLDPTPNILVESCANNLIQANKFLTKRSSMSCMLYKNHLANHLESLGCKVGKYIGFIYA